MTTYNEFTTKVAATVRGFSNMQDLENAVWEAVCGADPDKLKEHLEASDEWTETGHQNDAWTQNNAPNFSDASALGDWEGFDLSSVQEFCQDVLNAVVDAKGIPEEEY